MTFSLIHPSIRPHKWREIYEAWIAAAEHPQEVEYLLVVDEKWGFPKSDYETIMAPWIAERPGKTGIQNMCLWNSDGYVSSVNAAAKHAFADVLICIADDIWPAKGWDAALERAIVDRILGTTQTTYPQSFPGSYEFAIWVNNGGTAERRAAASKTIMEMPVVSRSRVERLGYLYYPGYKSMWADNDLAAHCMLDAAEGRCSLIRLEEPVFPHLHPVNDPSIPMDAAYQWQNRPQAYADGRKLFEARKAAKFTDVQIPTVSSKRRLAFCVAGQTFSLPWVARWTALIELGQQYDIEIVFAYGQTNVYHMRIGMARNVLRMDPPPSYVLWLDDDQLVDPQHVLQLIADLDEHPQIDMVAGWTVTGTDSYDTAPAISCGLTKGKIAFAKDLMEGPDDLVPVLYTGFPLVLMRYQLLVDVGAESFWPLCGDEFDNIPPGEDVAFCEAAHLGDNIRVDRRVGPLPHLKLRDIAAGVLACGNCGRYDGPAEYVASSGLCVKCHSKRFAAGVLG